MKIFLLIVEVLFTGFMIWRKVSRVKERNSTVFGGGLRIIDAAIAVCIVNFLTIIGFFSDVGYILI